MEVWLNLQRMMPPGQKLAASQFVLQMYEKRDAITRGRPFNLIHMPSTFKTDVFPLQPDAYSQTAFSRAQWQEKQIVRARTLLRAVASADDVVLRKLEWYRAGGEVSGRQRNDSCGVRM